eukprot:3904720-Rhodomonas_salina.2
MGQCLACPKYPRQSRKSHSSPRPSDLTVSSRPARTWALAHILLPVHRSPSALARTSRQVLAAPLSAGRWAASPLCRRQR